MKFPEHEKQRYETFVQEALDAAFQGWDFAYVNGYGSDVEEPLEWCYKNVVREYAADCSVLLDIGTGGGEFLASLQPLPASTSATESYPPNIPVAKERLEPLGVKVFGIEEGRQEQYPLPFEGNFFDLVVSRHEGYESRELYRILKSGGTFITQQVGRRNSENLRMIFGSIEDADDFDWDLDHCRQFLADAGFTIVTAREHLGYSRFYDIRALVYFMKALPWEFPGFDARTQRRQLLNIYLKILQDGYFDVSSHRFFVIARKV